MAIQTTEGRRHEFKVTSVTDDAINGETDSVRLADIEDMQITRLSPGKTAGAIGGGTLIVLAVLAALGAYAFGKAVEDGF